MEETVGVEVSESGRSGVDEETFGSLIVGVLEDV